MHASAVRILFNTVSIPDDVRLFATEACSQSIVTPLLLNPKRYASAVKSLVIQDPSFGVQQTYTGLFDAQAEAPQHLLNSFRPLDAQNLAWVLEVCRNIESFVWESSIPPPDGVCEVSGSHNWNDI